MKIYENMIELIGNTPILRLKKIEEKYGIKAKLFAKLESYNPGGSVKDRPALAMIEAAEKEGLLMEGGTIIEPTSGNMGIALSAIAARKGYKAIMVMPETMSVERRMLMKAYGAEIVLTEGAKGMQGAVDKANELLGKTDNAFMPSQFENPANPQKHYATTANEIWDDLDGQIDIFIAGFGTGGTVSGVGKRLKELNDNIKIVGIEPEASPLISAGTASAHKLQGLGANFVPKNLDKEVMDEIQLVSNDDAFSRVREMGTEEGLLVGVSAGAALEALIRLGELSENEGKTIVAVFPDTGERYLSMDGLFK